jgi:putative tricarboxylic transport membrane protein
MVRTDKEVITGTRRGFSLETAFDLLLALLGVVIMIASLGYGFGSFRRPGPGLYPFFIGLAILIFSGILSIWNLRFQAPPALVNQGGVKTFLLMMVFFSHWILLMPFFGYVVVTLIVTYGFCRVMKLEGWWKPLSVSAGTTLFIYLLFDYWLYIDLPRGFWR